MTRIGQAMRILATVLLAAAVMAGCGAGQPASDTGTRPLHILATETFLQDIAQNVAGDRLQIETLLPAGADPHAYQPTPADVRKVAESNLLIVNGAGFEAFLEKLLQNAGGQRRVIEAAAGLQGREPKAGEAAHHEGEADPHFWLDPVHTMRYVENIRAGLTAADPAGEAFYARKRGVLHGPVARAGHLDRKPGSADSGRAADADHQPRKLRLLR